MSRIDPDAARVLAGFAERRILVQRCGDCARSRFPPMPGCPWCGGATWQEADAVGTGTVYSWVSVRRELGPDSPPAPFTIATVELVEGCRMFGVLRGDEPSVPGESVRAVFVDCADRTDVEWERTQ